MKKRWLILIVLLVFILPATAADKNELLCCIDQDGKCYANRDSCDSFSAYVDDEDCKVERCNFGCCKSDSCFLGFKQECDNLQGEFFNNINDIDQCKNKCEIKQEYKRLGCLDTYHTNFEPNTCPPCADGYTKKCERTQNITTENVTLWLERAKCTREYLTECSLNPKCEKGKKIGEVSCAEEIDLNEYTTLKCRDGFYTDWKAYSCLDCPKGYNKECERRYDLKIFWLERAKCEKEYHSECMIGPSCGKDAQISSSICNQGQTQDYKRLTCSNTYYTDDWPWSLCLPCKQGYNKECEQSKKTAFGAWWTTRVKCTKEYYSSCSENPSCGKDKQLDSQKCVE